MEQYISKSALVAEIEKFEKALKNACKPNPFGNTEECMTAAELQALDVVKETINTLEVKEVDFEEYYHKFLEKEWFGNSHVRTVSEMMAFTAKHFFELGLKAQHDNWKVVDNINPPQADRNKIYCVFTKDRHILATVINHPKNEELLQWKCTEFPYHRYDMCEGDKYMQIV